MRLLLLVVFVAIAAAAAAGVAASDSAARHPRLEKLALRPADGTRARSALIRVGDLASGWSGGIANANRDSAPDCPWQDYSAFTLTGRAVSQFGHTGAQLQSSVQVFATHAHAIGDFTVDTRKGTARCEGEQLRKAIGQGAQLLSSRQIQAPKVGERAIAFRWVIKVGVSTIYLDAIEFVRGRAVAGVFALNVGRVLTGLDALARSMDVRLQPGVA